MKSRNGKTTVRINVYIDMKDKKILNEIKYKYHLSYSTIARILYEALMFNRKDKEHITEEEIKEKLMTLNDTYIYDRNTGKKTSIKPKNTAYWFFNDLVNGKPLKASCGFTNAIRLFTKDDYKKYYTEKEIQKIKNYIYSKFQTEYDEDWQGNNFQRMMPKYMKQNRQYYKRILENE